jgi:co-chaperonin GroES (HSP10)
MYRDLAQYNVMAGRIVALGPLAFSYKDENGLQRQRVEIGDWVTFRPFAGTYTSGGKVAGAGNWRYISSFQDVIGIIPADKMPPPEALLWNEDDEEPVPAAVPPAAAAFAFDNRK